MEKTGDPLREWSETFCPLFLHLCETHPPFTQYVTPVVIWFCADRCDEYSPKIAYIHPGSSVDDSLLESAARCLDSRSIAALGRLELDELAKARLDHLAQNANEGQLTPEEREVRSRCTGLGMDSTPPPISFPHAQRCFRRVAEPADIRQHVRNIRRSDTQPERQFAKVFID